LHRLILFVTLINAVLKDQCVPHAGVQ